MDQKLDENIHQGVIRSPIGTIHVSFNADGILSLNFNTKTLDDFNQNIDNLIFKNLIIELEKYFKRELVSFSVPLNPQGTAFQKLVWAELQKIPFGATFSYQEIAMRLGGKEKTRAVATAIAKNPILLLIPCHRVIGTNGTLTGFSGGIERKRFLLNLEGKNIPE